MAASSASAKFGRPVERFKTFLGGWRICFFSSTFLLEKAKTSVPSFPDDYYLKLSDAWLFQVQLTQL